jgi:hypothetical protein
MKGVGSRGENVPSWYLSAILGNDTVTDKEIYTSTAPGDANVTKKAKCPIYNIYCADGFKQIGPTRKQRRHQVDAVLSMSISLTNPKMDVHRKDIKE